MYKIKKYFQGVIKQGKMVRWPTSKQLMSYFAIVVCVVVFSAVACSIDDYIITQIVGALDRNLISSSSSETAAEFNMLINYFKSFLGVIYGK